MLDSNGESSSNAFTTDQEEDDDTGSLESTDEEDSDRSQRPLHGPGGVSVRVEGSRNVSVGPHLTYNAPPLTITGYFRQGHQLDFTELLPEIPLTTVRVEGSRDGVCDVHFRSQSIVSGPVTVNPIVQVISGDNAIPHQGLERAITAPSQEPGPPVENKRGGGILEVAPLWLRQHPFIGIGLSLGIVSLFALCLVWAVTTSSNNTLIEKIKIVTRPEWLADDPIKQERPLEHPVQYVVILHTAGEDCPTQETCSGSVRNIQALHIHTNGWSDIGYSFLVGGDGNVYEGRGWDTAGAFARGYNHRSIGIGFIGTFIAYPPVPRQIQAGQQLISKGVELGKISPDYKLVAHMQIRSTESPGLAFFEIIKTWPHWLENP